MNYQQTNPVVFISAEKGNLSFDENLGRTNQLLSELDGAKFRFKQVKGCYKGIEETSVMVAIDTGEDVSWLSSLAKRYDQECILYRDENQKAYLVYDGGVHEKIGYMVQIPKYESLFVDGYTYDPETKTYWGVK